MDPKGIMIREMSVTERQILHGITYMWNLKKSQTHRNRVKWWLPVAEEVM